MMSSAAIANGGGVPAGSIVSLLQYFGTLGIFAPVKVGSFFIRTRKRWFYSITPVYRKMDEMNSCKVHKFLLRR